MSAVDAIAAPLDAGRARVLRVLGPIAPRLLADRERRVGLTALVAVATAFLTTCVAPLWMLALGPIALGVPHLLADVRYLFVRTGLHRRADVCIAVGGPVLVGALSGHTNLGLLATFGAAIVGKGALSKRALAYVLWMALVAGAYACPRAALLVLTHGHNLLAVAFFWAWRARTGRYHWPALAALVGALALLASGALDGAVGRMVAQMAPQSRVLFEGLVGDLSPVGAPTVALRLVLAFTFLQSVHYAVWLRFIPEDDRTRPGLRSFASSMRALEQDVGRPVLLAACVTMATLVGWALVDLEAARHAYMRVAGVHAYMELAVLTLLLLEGHLPLRGAS
jgi:hypothetical protein